MQASCNGMKSYLAVDAGTTAVKVLLADEQDRPLFAGELPVTVCRCGPGAAETDMEAYWAALCRLTKRAAVQCPDAWKDLAGVCAAGQGDGLWPLDREGRAYMPAIVWQDTRAAGFCPQQDESWRYHSNDIQPGTRSAILAWLKGRKKQLYDRVALPLGCVGFLNYRLTGVPSTDASCCGDCFDIQAGTHIPALYEQMGIGEMADRLPPVFPCNAPVGVVTAEAARQTGILPGVPVYAGCLDATAAVLGRSALREGRVSVCAGTTLLVMYAQREAPRFPLAEGVYADRLPYAQPLYRLCFAPRCGASAIAEEKAVYAPQESYETMYRRIARLPMGCGGLTYLPFRGGERSPFCCLQAEVGYYGLRPEHTPWHRLRAVAESVLFAARHCMEVSGRHFAEAELSGGGARSPVLCQMAADIFGIPVMVKGGVYAGVDGCIALMRQAEGLAQMPEDDAAAQRYSPAPENRQAAEKAYKRYRQCIDRMLPVWRNKTAEGR